MKMYKLFRGLLKASAFTAVMFVMQACYGTPQKMDDPYYVDEEEENSQAVDTLSPSPIEFLDETLEK